jgi:NAD(P)-dependent dehydrogenase (short-subunit alcohol dehydrogenase family)
MVSLLLAVTVVSGVPADVANLVLFLVSERAEWSTGQRLTVDGGEFPYR